MAEWSKAPVCKTVQPQVQILLCPQNWYIMNLDKHTAQEDFPLSGGEEPDFKVPKWAFVTFFVFIALVIVATLHMKGVF